MQASMLSRKATLAMRPSSQRTQSRSTSRLSPIAAAAAYKVTLQGPGGEQQHLMCEEGKSVLEAALAANVDLPHLCHTGSCGACAAKVAGGDMEPLDSYLLDDAQKDAGYTLLCCTHPRSDMLLLTHQEADMYTKPYNI